MKRIAVAATILSLNLATMSAAAQDKPIGAHGAAALGRITEGPATEGSTDEGLVIRVDPDQVPVEVMLSKDLGLEGVELDPELLRALADLERNRAMLDDPIFHPDYTQTQYAGASYSSGNGGRLALRLIPLGIGLIVLIMRATRRED